MEIGPGAEKTQHTVRRKISIPPSDISVKAGSFIFHEGENSREIYIVKQGEVQIFQRRGDLTVELARLGERSVFGEMALIDNQPRSASARALADSILTVIAPTTFAEMIRQIPPWLQAVVKVITRRLRETNRKIDLHTVRDPLESFCLFLSIQCRVATPSQAPPLSFPLFPLYDAFTLVSRIKREEAQKQTQILAQKQLLVLNKQEELIIPDPDLISLLAEYLRCARQQIPFPYDFLHPVCASILEKLLSVPQSQIPSDPEALLSWLHASDNRVEQSHLKKLGELGVFKTEATMWTLNVSRAHLIAKAIYHGDSFKSIKRV